MNKDRIVKEITLCFEDMKKALVENSAAELIPLFRDYTDEIIEIVKKEK